MSNISGSSAAMSYANEAYSASLAKAAQMQKGQQVLDLLQSTNTINPTPAANSGSHMTTDNLGQNVNIRV